MLHSAHDAYLESRVLSADPVELVVMLYQAAIGAVQEARRHLADGKIAERSKAISRACDIVLELQSALDKERGGEIAARLGALYAYMLRRLLEANLQQADAPLGEVLGLLSTVAEGWAGIRKPAAPQAPASTPWTYAVAEEPAAAYAGESYRSMSLTF